MRIALVVNPKSGANRGAAVAARLEKSLRAAGRDVGVFFTERSGHATNLAAHALDLGYEILCAVGGDGTLAETLAGTIDRPRATLGICPIGTANVVAREFGVPVGNPEAAATILLCGRTKSIDFGYANGRAFLANCGVGFDSRVVRRIHLARRRSKKALSMAGYALPGLAEMCGHRAPELRVAIDGKDLPGFFSSVVVSNLRNYGGVMSVTPEARPDDGCFDIYARIGEGPLRLVRGFVRAILKRRERAGLAVYGTGRSIRIVSARRYPVQVDGDAFGATPLAVEIAPRQVELIVPGSEGER